MKKLSAVQEKVITLMSEGYELGYYNGYNSNVRLQHGGMGRGGKTVDVRKQTHSFLKKKGFITLLEHRGFALSVYELTDKAKEYLTKTKTHEPLH
jgi:hypothetical protein